MTRAQQEELIKKQERYSQMPPRYSGPSADAKPTNPKDAIGVNKIQMHLFPVVAINLGSLALLNGALKYGRANWRAKGVRATIYMDATLRHLYKWFEGEDIDPESGVNHLGHALACLAIIVDAANSDKLNDDRNYKGGHSVDSFDYFNEEARKVREKVSVGPIGLVPERHYTIKDNSNENEGVNGGVDNATV